MRLPEVKQVERLYNVAKEEHGDIYGTWLDIRGDIFLEDKDEPNTNDIQKSKKHAKSNSSKDIKKEGDVVTNLFDHHNGAHHKGYIGELVK